MNLWLKIIFMIMLLIKMDITRYCILGNVDASKSTLIGVLKTGELDDGKGKSRSSILQMQHEKLSGNTTNSNLIKIYQDPSKKGKCIQLIDLPGHKNYFGMVLRGIMEYNPSYAIIVVSSIKGINEDIIKNKGVHVNMTKIHMQVCSFLKLPMIIVIGKIDNCTDDRLAQTILEVKSYTKKLGCKFLFHVKDEDTNSKAIEAMDMGHGNMYMPYFLLSNVTGVGLDLFKNFIFQLKVSGTVVTDVKNLRKFAEERKFEHLFEIFRTYYVNGIGLIVFGYNKMGVIRKNDILNVGPFNNRYIQVRVKSMHGDERNDIDILPEGQYGCLAIKPVDPKEKLHKKSLNKGKVVTDSHIVINNIETTCKITHHHTLIEKKYKTYLHTLNVGCGVSILDASSFPIRTGDEVNITFKFMTPQFVYPGCKFFFREDNIKGFGIISSVNT
jgi:GTPase